MLLIQEIDVSWTKASRGAPGSIQRNAVPECLEMSMPKGAWPSDKWLYQKSMFSEHKNFANPFNQIDALEAFKLKSFGALEFNRENEGIGVTLKPGDWRGMPGYPPPSGRHFILHDNAYARIRYNWRIAHEEGGWAYGKTVFNLIETARFNAGIFVQNEPVIAYEDMHWLR